jgi:arginine decarboxylase
MWNKNPETVSLVKGAAEGLTSLNAFDNALLEAGIGNLNLIKVSSIIPKGAKITPLPDIPPGSLTPTVYSYITSSIPGEILSACVGIGLSDNEFGLIYEYSHRGSARTAEEIVRRMIEEGFKKRNLKLTDLRTVSSEHKVERVGCALAAAVLWWEES